MDQQYPSIGCSAQSLSPSFVFIHEGSLHFDVNITSADGQEGFEHLHFKPKPTFMMGLKSVNLGNTGKTGVAFGFNHLWFNPALGKLRAFAFAITPNGVAVGVPLEIPVMQTTEGALMFYLSPPDDSAGETLPILPIFHFVVGPTAHVPQVFAHYNMQLSNLKVAE